jgi:hypothetical protein
MAVIRSLAVMAKRHSDDQTTRDKQHDITAPIWLQTTLIWKHILFK